MRTILIGFLTFFLINSQFAFATSALSDRIKTYNTNTNNIQYYIDKFQTTDKWRFVAQYLEQNKSKPLPQISVANKKMYYFKSTDTVVQFTPQMANQGKVFVGKTPVEFQNQGNSNLLLNQVTGAVKTPEAIMTTLVLMADGIINPQSVKLSNDPIFAQKISEYNSLSAYPEGFISKFQTKEDSEHFKFLLDQSKVKTLPQIKKVKNVFVMEFSDIKDKIYFTEQSISKGILKINNKEINFSSARNLKEITDILIKNVKKNPKTSFMFKLLDSLVLSSAYAFNDSSYDKATADKSFADRSFWEGNWYTLGTAVAAMAGIFAIAKYSQNKKNKGKTKSSDTNTTTSAGSSSEEDATTSDTLNASGEKYRVIVSSDIGGYDSDDQQSMVHYLMYADKFITEGLISSPPGAGRASHIHEVIAAYSTDYAKLKAKGDFPAPESLSAVVKQGATEPAGENGYGTATEGSSWIVQKANESDKPLYILVWGSATDIAQALHDDPNIKPKLRVYYIGAWNTEMDQKARDYIYNEHSDLWLIECNTTMRGMYNGGNQAGDLENGAFIEQHIKDHGALGAFFYDKQPDNKRAIKMGDTPSVLYMLNGNPADPTSESWGGQFAKGDHGPNYFTDISSEAVGEYNGANTVAKWREEYLRDWQKRWNILK